MKFLLIQTEALRYFGYTEEESRFVYLVATNPGYFACQPFLQFIKMKPENPANAVLPLPEKWWEKKHASSKEYLRHGRVFHLFSRDLYEVIGRENDRFRRALSTKSDLSGNFQRTRTHGARRIGPDSPSESTKPLPSLPVFHFLAEHYPKADFGADAVRPKSVNTISHVEHVCALTSFRVSVPKSRKTSSRSTFRDG